MVLKESRKETSHFSGAPFERNTQVLVGANSRMIMARLQIPEPQDNETGFSEAPVDFQGTTRAVLLGGQVAEIKGGSPQKEGATNRSTPLGKWGRSIGVTSSFLVRGLASTKHGKTAGL